MKTALGRGCPGAPGRWSSGRRRGWGWGGIGSGLASGWERSQGLWAASELGYLLPMASGGALLLLLSCLSVQSLIWGHQLDGRGAWQRRQTDDLLASAAQTVAAALNGSHRCLLPLPASHWTGQTLNPGCARSADAAALMRLPLPDGEVRLLGWQPTLVPPASSPGPVPAGAPNTTSGLLTLGRTLTPGAEPVQRRYRLRLAGEPLRVVTIQELDR